VLDDQAVPQPKALGVPEVDSMATERGSGDPQPRDNLVTVCEELLEFDSEVGAERSNVGEALPRLLRPERLAL